MANTKITPHVLDSTLISGHTAVTAAAGDYVLIQDVSDSNALKKALVSDLAQNEESPTFTGNVVVNGTAGIGTSSIDSNIKLQIEDSAYPVIALDRSASLADGNHLGYINFQNNGDVYGYIGAWVEDVSETDGELRFATQKGTSLTDRMVITSDGYVGIGETTPLGQLHVKTADSGATADASADELVIEGSANSGMSILSGATSTGSIYFGDSGTNWDGYIAYSQNDRKMTLGTAAGSAISIDSSRNVGIGTASPTAKLHVEVADGSEFLKATIAGNEAWAFKGASGSGSMDYVSFGISGSTQAMAWQEDGNVGIGTTGPAAPLDVVSNSSAVGIDLRGRSADNIGQLTFESNDSGTTYSQFQSLSTEFKIKSVANIPMSFHTNNTERMKLRSDGIICIGGEPSNLDTGENNAYSFLRIRGNTYGSAYAGRLSLSCGYKAYQLGTNDGIGEIWFADDTGGDWAYIACQAAAQGGGTSGNPNNADDYPGKLLFATTADGAGSPTLHLTIDQNGRLLHGRTSAVNDSNGVGNPPLQIENATPGIHFYGTGTGNYSHSGGISFGSAESGGDNSWFYIYSHDENFHIYNNNARAAYFPQGSTATWQYGSDRRLKENINDLTLGLDTLNNLKPRKFNWKEDGLEDIGFIAQEVQDLIPLAVSGSGLEWEDGEDQAVKEAKTLKIANDKLIPVLVKAIQELSTELDAAKARITTLEG